MQKVLPIIAEDVPHSYIVGIDNYSFQIPKQGDGLFYGIKNIPSQGVHTIYFQRQEDTNNSPSMHRYGYWFYTGAEQQMLIKYNASQEQFEPSLQTPGIIDDVARRYNHLMVNYPSIEEISKDTFDWHYCASFLNWEQLCRILPSNSSNGFLYVDSSMISEQEYQSVAKLLPGTEEDQGNVFHYTEISFKSKDAIRSDSAMKDFYDKSYYFHSIVLKKNYSNNFKLFFSELQFSFLNALVYGNYGSSLQWHSMIELILKSSSIAFIAKFDEVVSKQVASLPEEYVDFLLNESMWSSCIYDSWQSKNIPLTSEIILQRLPGLASQDDDYEEPGDFDSDEDAYKPVIVSRVTYRAP